MGGNPSVAAPWTKVSEQFPSFRPRPRPKTQPPIQDSTVPDRIAQRRTQEQEELC